MAQNLTFLGPKKIAPFGQVFVGVELSLVQGEVVTILEGSRKTITRYSLDAIYMQFICNIDATQKQLRCKLYTIYMQLRFNLGAIQMQLRCDIDKIQMQFRCN